MFQGDESCTHAAVCLVGLDGQEAFATIDAYNQRSWTRTVTNARCHGVCSPPRPPLLLSLISVRACFSRLGNRTRAYAHKRKPQNQGQLCKQKHEDRFVFIRHGQHTRPLDMLCIYIRTLGLVCLFIFLSEGPSTIGMVEHNTKKEGWLGTYTEHCIGLLN